MDDRHLKDIGKIRVEGESRVVKYDASIHPGITYRLFRQGAGIAQIAAAIGVTPEVMEGWLETRPEMEAARLRAQARDGEIMESLESHAIGVKDPETGRWTGGNPAPPEVSRQVAARHDGGRRSRSTPTTWRARRAGGAPARGDVAYAETGEESRGAWAVGGGRGVRGSGPGSVGASTPARERRGPGRRGCRGPGNRASQLVGERYLIETQAPAMRRPPHRPAN